MKMSLAILVLLFSGLAFADANSDAYKAGSSYGKGSASQGTSALKNTDAVSSAIPGYTSNPSETNYYGGVRGGDSGLSDKGQSALQGSNAGQAVIDASTKNPSPVIDPNAPFITAGKAYSTEPASSAPVPQCPNPHLKTSSVTVMWVTSKPAAEQHPLQGHMSMIMRIPLTPLILRTEN